MDLIDKYSLSHLFYKNTLKIQQIILSTLEKPPNRVKDGYLYCFKPVNFVNTQTKFKLKIGQTYRTVEKRIGEQDGIQMYSIYSVFYRKLERMCHLFFKFANVRGIDDGYEMFLFTKRT